MRAVCSACGGTACDRCFQSGLEPFPTGFNKDELKLRSGWSMASVKTKGNDTISDGYCSFASRNDLFGCPHGWWLNSPADGRIAKIRLGQRPISK